MALLDWLGPAFSIGTVAVAIAIVVLARRSVAALFLALYLAAFGLIGLQAQAIQALGGSIAFTAKMTWVLHVASNFAMLAFAIVYPNLGLTRGRRIALGALTALAAAGAVVLLALPDAWFYDPVTGERGMTAIVGPILSGTVDPIAITLLGLRWLTSPPSAYRTQLAWGFLPLTWWTLHDGFGYTIYPWVMRATPPADPALPLLVLLWIIRFSVAFVLAIMLVALARTIRGRGAPDDRAMGFVLLYALPLTLVQVVFDASPGSGIPPYAHLVLDYAVVPLAVYGVLRHRVVDIDLKLKRGIHGSTVAASFLAVFFVVGSIAQEFLADTLGWLAGGAAAGALIFAIAPIQRAAERLSNAAMPNVRDDGGYLTYRRYQIYRVAVEGMLRDGIVEPSEATALRSLREELGLSIDDHRALEQDARARLARA